MISVEVKGLSKTIQQLKKYRSRIRERKKQFLNKLGEMGVALEIEGMGNIQYDGDYYLQSYYKWKDSSTLIIALEGEEVTFIEFGTGTYYTEEHEKADELGMIRGEFGYKQGANPPWEFESSSKTNRTEKSRVVREGSWGVRIETYGNPPNRIAYNTGKFLREIILEVAKEVFSE